MHRIQLIFATNNRHKADEVKAVVPAGISVIALQEAGIAINIPEPHATLEANAAEKARTIYKLTQKDCFSEDTGLEVTALNGEPGVYSARYAGEVATYVTNIEKLLANLKEEQNRQAQFRTVLCLILQGTEYTFEGICKGRITFDVKGTGGFGYDPVFLPDGATKTFAEMLAEEKNSYSHRRKAVDKLVIFLSTLGTN